MKKIIYDLTVLPHGFGTFDVVKTIRKEGICYYDSSLNKDAKPPHVFEFDENELGAEDAVLSNMDWVLLEHQFDGIMFIDLSK